MTRPGVSSQHECYLSTFAMSDDPDVLGVCFRALFQVIDSGLGIPCKITRRGLFVYPVGFSDSPVIGS